MKFQVQFWYPSDLKLWRTGYVIYIEIDWWNPNAHCSRTCLQRKNQQNHWSFYPSGPFTIAHFIVRHPVRPVKFLISQKNMFFQTWRHERWAGNTNHILVAFTLFSFPLITTKRKDRVKVQRCPLINNLFIATVSTTQWSAKKVEI